MLRVQDLTIRLRHQDQPLVEGVSFSIGRGELFCLVGESGSGKSLTALAIMRILDRGFLPP
ncbi:MAG TPA: ATP-binding cassette domain-containing protein, partial [Thioalkalivibrio sp.]|nr:ATP-binding cassette domain-containing protein [Thioalkalivibrio sp.]